MVLGSIGLWRAAPDGGPRPPAVRLPNGDVCHARAASALRRMPTPVAAEPLINTAILETDTLPGCPVNISRANGTVWARGDCVLS